MPACTTNVPDGGKVPPSGGRAMDWVWYLFRFEGRINRAKLWLAALIMICWMIFLGMLIAGLAALLGRGPKDIGF
jgi:hypothetical protein